MNFSHVLISRPEAECTRLAALLQAAGMSPVAMPAFGFRAIGGAVEPPENWGSAPARLAVFTSPRAAAFGLAAIDRRQLDGALIAAIGPATEAELESAGLQVDLVPSDTPTSEGLLAMAALRDTPGEAIIFAAPGGRELLQEGLTALDWNVSMAMVYVRVPLDPPSQAVEAVINADKLASIWTSATALESLLEKLPPAACEKVLAGRLLVVSGRLEKLAHKLGAGEVHLTDGADNTAIMDCLAGLSD